MQWGIKDGEMHHAATCIYRCGVFRLKSTAFKYRPVAFMLRFGLPTVNQWILCSETDGHRKHKKI